MRWWGAGDAASHVWGLERNRVCRLFLVLQTFQMSRFFMSFVGMTVRLQMFYMVASQHQGVDVYYIRTANKNTQSSGKQE